MLVFKNQCQLCFYIKKCVLCLKTSPFPNYLLQNVHVNAYF